MSPVRTLVLVRGLPPESAFLRSYLDGAVWGWSEEAAVTTVELLVSLIRITLAAHGAKKSQLPKPVQIPRPWENLRRTSQPDEDALRRTKRPATVEEVLSSLTSVFTPPRT